MSMYPQGKRASIGDEGMGGVGDVGVVGGWYGIA